MTDTPEEAIKQRTAELNATVVDLPADVGLSILTEVEVMAETVDGEVIDLNEEAP